MTVEITSDLLVLQGARRRTHDGHQSTRALQCRFCGAVRLAFGASVGKAKGEFTPNLELKKVVAPDCAKD